MFSVFSLIRSGDTMGAIMFVLSGCFVVFFCTPLHELSHAWAAYKLGDTTAKNDGRLTFNPIKHIDPIGMIMILLFGFGYAKPVPVNIARLKNPKRDMALVSIAGPASNLVLAFIFNFLAYTVAYFSGDSGIVELIYSFFFYAAYINIVLAAFNILPIPPLDGSKVLAAVLPKNAYYKYMRYERYAMIILLVILVTGILDSILGVVADALMSFISIIPKLIFGFSIY